MGVNRGILNNRQELLCSGNKYNVKLPMNLFLDTMEHDSIVKRYGDTSIVLLIVFLQAYKSQFNTITFSIADVIYSYNARMNYKHDKQTYGIIDIIKFLINEGYVKYINNRGVSVGKLQPKHIISLDLCNLIEKDCEGNDINYIDIPWSIVQKIYNSTKSTKVRKGLISFYIYIYMECMESIERKVVLLKNDIKEKLLINSDNTFRNYSNELTKLGMFINGRTKRIKQYQGDIIRKDYTFTILDEYPYSIVVDIEEVLVGGTRFLEMQKKKNERNKKHNRKYL